MVSAAASRRLVEAAARLLAPASAVSLVMGWRHSGTRLLFHLTPSTQPNTGNRIK